MAGSKLFPPKSETRPPTKLPRCRSAAFSDREQVDKPASLDGKGRPGCHERPSYLDAWLSCAGSGELAPEVGNSGACKHESGAFGSTVDWQCGAWWTGVEIEDNTLKLARKPRR